MSIKKSEKLLIMGSIIALFAVPYLSVRASEYTFLPTESLAPLGVIAVGLAITFPAQMLYSFMNAPSSWKLMLSFYAVLAISAYLTAPLYSIQPTQLFMSAAVSTVFASSVFLGVLSFFKRRPNG